MKGKPIYLIAILLLLIAPSFAQDTIIFKNGEKVWASDMSIRHKIVFYKTQDDFIDYSHTAKKDEIKYIKFSSGKVVEFHPDIIPAFKRKGDVSVNVGIAFSFITWAVGGVPLFNLNEGEPSYISVSPAYDINADYYLSNKIGVGLGLAYQKLTDQPMGNGNLLNWETENISRTNISCRLLFNESPKSEEDFYLLLRPGVSYWTDEATSAITNRGVVYSVNGIKYERGDLYYALKPSFQFAIGYRFFISSFGFHFEVGIGTPYQLEGGLSLRIKPKRDK